MNETAREQESVSANFVNPNDDIAISDKHLKWVGTTKKIFVISALIAFIVYAIVERDSVGDTLTNFLEWVEDAGVLGPLAYIGVYIIATVCFLPGSILTLGAGFVFNKAFGIAGIFIAVLVVLVGATIGAICAFLLGRTVFRESVQSYASRSPTFTAIDRVIGDQGLKLIFLLRLSPLLPFNASNYVYGITAVSLRNYSIACLGMIPGIIAYVLVGSSLGSLSDTAETPDGGIGLTLFIIIGTVLAFGVAIYVSILARREIKKIVGDPQELEEFEVRDVDDPSDGNL